MLVQTISTGTADYKVQRDAVLTAALTIFSLEGFAGESVRQIASLANCNHAMIRYYFGTKDALWKAAVEYLFEREKNEMSMSDGLSDALLRGERSAAETWIRRYVAYCRRHHEHARIMVQASIRNDEKLAWAADELISRKHGQVLPYIEALMKTGVLPACQSALNLGYILVAACQTMFMLAPEIEQLYGPEDLQKHEDRHADAVVATLLR